MNYKSIQNELKRQLFSRGFKKTGVKMHQYIKAIGFDEIRSKKEFISILKEVEENYSQLMAVSYTEKLEYCEMRKEYGQDIGIAVCGELDEEESFDMEYYFPYFEGSEVTLYSEIHMEKSIEKEQYFGVCEDSRLGINLIFYLQNGIEYLSQKPEHFHEHKAAISLSALSLTGMILLPVHKTETQIKIATEDSKNRRDLLTAARKGDQAAIETLTLDDMNIYTNVSKRLEKEDVFTIVDSYFMPLGVECDVYSIMGEILAVRERENSVTHKKLYQMKLNVNELVFDVCIPRERLLGEPEIGRRFKGEIWLQGRLDFSMFK